MASGDYDWANLEEEMNEEIKESGVWNIDEFVKEKLQQWKSVEVNIAITGNSGAGKSSFTNAIREIYDDDEGAASVGVTECTKEPTPYAHPTNSNITFWDLPGIGTPNYPDLTTYVEKVKLEKYDAFLILTATRFTENDLLLAKKIRSMQKRFFLIRTKIDDNVRSEKRKRSYDEEAMLREIRRNCSENLGNLLSDEKDVFLISNHEPDKWDFARLTQAILDALPKYQRQSLTLSLGEAITRSSKEIFQRKVDILKGRIPWAAAASAAGACVPIPGLSVGVDAALILRELTLYRSQLLLPQTGSAEFLALDPTARKKVAEVTITTAAQLSSFLVPYSAKLVVGEAARCIPVVGWFVASALSFTTTREVLHLLLESVKDVALSIISKAADRAAAELESEVN
ncbi:interferon-inducible GTPase 1-like [Acropora millepora]|uniref:interferon-inducible GTPase 1-like n=1 Tax=Acropora millepora TaxID=45264 RepID=UPI001CF4D4E6|nr:interferon-inducible GTPase 1-like [Acropora millepora]